MKLYILILNKTECMHTLVSELLESGIHGATIYDSMGALQYVGHDMIDPPPMFGSLRKYLHPDNAGNKTIFILLDDDKVAEVSRIVNKVTGGLSKPDVGISFTLPVYDVEGIN